MKIAALLRTKDALEAMVYVKLMDNLQPPPVILRPTASRGAVFGLDYAENLPPENIRTYKLEGYRKTIHSIAPVPQYEEQ